MGTVGRTVTVSRIGMHKGMLWHKPRGYGIRRVWYKKEVTVRPRPRTLTIVEAHKIAFVVTQPRPGTMDPRVEEVRKTTTALQTRAYETIFTVIHQRLDKAP